MSRRYQFTGHYVQDRKRFAISGNFRLEDNGEQIKSGSMTDHGSPDELRTLEGAVKKERGKRKLSLLIHVPVDNKFNIAYKLESLSQSDSIEGDYEGHWLPAPKGKEMRVTSGPHDSKIGGPDFYGAVFLGPMAPSKKQMKPHSVALTIRAA